MATEYHPPKSLSHWFAEGLVSYGPRGSSLGYLYQHVKNRIINWRTIVVFVDGACAGNGTPGAVAGIGVYFGPWSEYNVSARVRGGQGQTQTNQRAEILAALKALRVVKNKVEPNNQNLTRVIIVSDSQYVVDAMTKWVYRWRENGWRNVKGERVVNYKDLRRLERVIGELAEVGVRVRFWRVGREENEDADLLARAALY